MTWGRIFMIDGYWIVGTILIILVLWGVDALLHVLNHKGWADLSRLIIYAFVVFGPPVLFTAFMLCVKLVRKNGLPFGILVLVLILGRWILGRFIFYRKMSQLVREPHGSMTEEFAAACCEEFYSEKDFTQYHGEQVQKKHGKSDEDLEHLIQGRYLALLISRAMGKFGKADRFIMQRDKKACVDALIRYHSRKMQADPRSGIKAWTFLKNGSVPGRISHLQLEFLDERVVVIALGWKNKWFAVVGL